MDEGERKLLAAIVDRRQSIHGDATHCWDVLHSKAIGSLWRHGDAEIGGAGPWALRAEVSR